MTFLVEPTCADSSHAGTVSDIERTLAVRALPHPRSNRDRDDDAQMGSSSAVSQQSSPFSSRFHRGALLLRRALSVCPLTVSRLALLPHHYLSCVLITGAADYTTASRHAARSRLLYGLDLRW
jgi:hypothetical protein